MAFSIKRITVKCFVSWPWISELKNYMRNNRDSGGHRSTWLCLLSFTCLLALFAGCASSPSNKINQFLSSRKSQQHGDLVIKFSEVPGDSINLLRRPVKQGSVSSGYGMRIHPILAKKQMHLGLDFAASVGTPVYAAGSGVVVVAARWGTYGNYIRIRHNSTYETAYAHLNGFADGIDRNVEVSQGQVIGYVGSTGRSTAPHLHYEVLANGQRIDPQGNRKDTSKGLSAQTGILNKIKSQVTRYYHTTMDYLTK